MAHMPCALLVGHSFVRRTTKFIERNQEDGSYTHTFGLESTCTVKTIGTGGRTVDKLIKYDLQMIYATSNLTLTRSHCRSSRWLRFL